MRHRTPKVRALRIHAKRRLSERYGIAVNRVGLAEIVILIQSGKAKFLERQSNRVTVWDVTFRGQQIRVVYDTHRHAVVTALPVEERVSA